MASFLSSLKQSDQLPALDAVQSRALEKVVRDEEWDADKAAQAPTTCVHSGLLLQLSDPVLEAELCKKWIRK